MPMCFLPERECVCVCLYVSMCVDCLLVWWYLFVSTVCPRAVKYANVNGGHCLCD